VQGYLDAIRLAGAGQLMTMLHCEDATLWRHAN